MRLHRRHAPRPVLGEDAQKRGELAPAGFTRRAIDPRLDLPPLALVGVHGRAVPSRRGLPLAQTIRQSPATIAKRLRLGFVLRPGDLCRPRHLQLHEPVLDGRELGPALDGDVLELEQRALQVDPLLGVFVHVDAELLQTPIVEDVLAELGVVYRRRVRNRRSRGFRLVWPLAVGRRGRRRGRVHVRGVIVRGGRRRLVVVFLRLFGERRGSVFCFAAEKREPRRASAGSRRLELPSKTRHLVLQTRHLVLQLLDGPLRLARVRRHVQHVGSHVRLDLFRPVRVL
mmetsp:Transcript_14822/g.62545  ORF Transcript_14822/g.62545 Transcript_14822/m.62545 type:complete len:285 (-) Transcript_14822:325-1179(-)